MTQLVILSGKGGTGKTSLSASLAHLAAAESPELLPILVDADVDAANLELLLNAKRIRGEDFMGGSLAVLDQAACSACGRCKEVCRYGAVLEEGNVYKIDPLACEGCAACLYECPQQAITMKIRQAGEWYLSETRYGLLYHAHLYPAQENSGKLVAHIKRQAQMTMDEMGSSWMLVDGPPGIGCPVISAVSGADAVLAVTEPSLAGIHDLERVIETSEYFQVPVYVCINKADLYPEGAQGIEQLCRQRKIPLLGKIPYDLDVARAMSAGIPITVYNPEGPAAESVVKIWHEITHLIPAGRSADRLIQL